MPKFKPRFGTINHQGLLHRVREWAKKRGGRIYPETEQLNSKPGVAKIRIVYSAAMIIWLIRLQVSVAAATALLRIGAVLFNIDGNEGWIVNMWPDPNFIPLVGPWQHQMVAQGISCGGNKVRVIGQEKDFYIIECLKPFKSGRPKETPRSHPWLFAWLYEVDVITGEAFKRGLLWPLFSKTGKAYVHKSLITLEVA